MHSTKKIGTTTISAPDKLRILQAFKNMLPLAKEVFFPAWKRELKGRGEKPKIIDIDMRKQEDEQKKDALLLIFFKSTMFFIPSKIAASISQAALRNMAIADNLSMTTVVSRLALSVQGARLQNPQQKLALLEARLSSLGQTLKDVRDNISGPNHEQVFFLRKFLAVLQSMKDSLLKSAAGSAAAEFERSFMLLKQQVSELEQNKSALLNGDSGSYVERTTAAVERMDSQLRSILEGNGEQGIS